MPVGGEVVDQRGGSPLRAATSTPRVGSSRISTRGSRNSQLREQDLLLVAAGEGRHPHRRVRRVDRQRRSRSARVFTRSSARRRPRIARRLPADRAKSCSRDGEIMNRPWSLRLSGRNAIRRRSHPRASGSCVPCRRRRSCPIDRIGADDRARDLGAAAAHEAGEADDLPGPDRRARCPGARAFAVQPATPRARPARRRAGRLLELGLARRPIIAATRRLGRLVGRRRVRTRRPFRITVTVSASVEHLVEEVRDEDDRGAAGAQRRIISSSRSSRRGSATRSARPSRSRAPCARSPAGSRPSAGRRAQRRPACRVEPKPTLALSSSYCCALGAPATSPSRATRCRARRSRSR